MQPGDPVRHAKVSYGLNPKQTHNWFAVEELNLSCYIGEPIVITICTHELKFLTSNPNNLSSQVGILGLAVTSSRASSNAGLGSSCLWGSLEALNPKPYLAGHVGRV